MRLLSLNLKPTPPLLDTTVKLGNEINSKISSNPFVIILFVRHLQLHLN